MMSAARLALEAAERGARPELEAVPPWQWAIYFEELAVLCPSSLDVVPGRDFARQRNALRVELVPSTTPRCSRRSPDGRGLAWLLSGGSPLAYGACCVARCPRARRHGTTSR